MERGRAWIRCLCPGRGAARSAAPLIRDRSKFECATIPGLQRTAARCAAPGTRGYSEVVSPCGVQPRQEASKIHLQDVEAADVAVDGVDDLALVDEHVVELDGAGGRHRRRPRHGNAALLGVGASGGAGGTNTPIGCGWYGWAMS